MSYLVHRYSGSSVSIFFRCRLFFSKEVGELMVMIIQVLIFSMISQTLCFFFQIVRSIGFASQIMQTSSSLCSIIGVFEFVIMI